jgi:hypothetical protein
VPRRSSGGSRPPPSKHKAWGEPVDQGLLELDRFSGADLDRWRQASQQLDALHRELYHGLEVQRNGRWAQLLDALRACPPVRLEFSGWHRAVSYRHSLSPLSLAGSLRGIGGRFNVGQDLRIEGFEAWPALYFAEDFETAYREKFQLPRGSRIDGLTPEDLALEREEGFSDVLVSGCIETAIDLSDQSSLESFVNLIAHFRMPESVLKLARKLGIPARAVSLIRSTSKLLKVVLEQNWRIWPAQFGLPSQSQTLGRLLMLAGYEAIVYPSTKGGGRCVAALPMNFANGGSFVELKGPHPPEVAYPRLDSKSWVHLSKPA